MTDIMRLADTMAAAMASDKDAVAVEASTALQSAVEALQAENERLTDSMWQQGECAAAIRNLKEPTK